MTCIVGLSHKGRVWIGGDSAGVAGLDLTIRSDEKVFRLGEMVIGFTSSFRMGQILRYCLTLPERDAKSTSMQYLVGAFIPRVRACLKDHGWMGKDDDRESGGTFLVGYRGALFKIDSDFQVGVTSTGYDACGCGQSFARGAFFATPTAKPKDRVALALKAAEAMSAGVRGPFTIIEGGAS